MKPEQVRGWVFKLTELFQEICKEKNISLTVPLITIADLGESKLGFWSRSKREITISLETIQEFPYHQIIHVLKHEMAHQFVDEVLCRTDQRPHGDLFKEACRVLDVSTEAALKKSPHQDRYVQKIEKLLALSTSMNQHEAEAALTKAQELSFKYNVSLAGDGTSEYCIRPLGEIRKRIASFEWIIMNILSEFYFVKTLKIFHRQESADGHLWQFEIYGTQHNIDTAEYVYYFLLNNAETLWKKYRAEQGKNVSRMRNSYMSGIFDGFRQRLRQEQELLKRKYEVVRLIDPDLEDFFSECNPRISRRKISTSTDRDVYSDGMKEGRKLKMKPGLRKQSRGYRGLFLTDKQH